jgi:tousled-like kinase
MQCLYGKRPFGHELSQQGILQQRAILNAREVVFPPRPAVSAEAKDFIRQCLTYDKDARPDVLTLCAHPYISNAKPAK